MENDYVKNKKSDFVPDDDITALQSSKPGVIITVAREHGSSGKQIAKIVAERLGIPFYI